MAELDAELSGRLSRLAAAVPVASGQLDAVHREAVHARRTVLMAWVTPLVLLVVGGTVAGLLGLNPFAAGAITESTRIGDFELTITSAKPHYDVNEPISLSATLAYVGTAGRVEIAHMRGDAIGFGLVEPVLGDLYLGPASDLGGRRPRISLAAGMPLRAAFKKSGGWSLDEPRAQEKRAFLADPVLRLPAGRWHPFAQAVLWAGDNLEDAITLTVDIEIAVGGGAPSSPVVDRDADGPFSIELRSPRAVYLESDPIDVTGTLVYSGSTPAAVTAFVPLAFSIAEPVLGIDVHDLQRTDAVCPPTEGPQPGERFERPFTKSGSVPADDPAYLAKRAWLDAPELRLPPGTWHLRVRSSMLYGSCSTAISLEAEIEITVLPDPEPSPTGSLDPTPAPLATEPPFRATPPPAPDGSPIEIDRDDAFELRMDPVSRGFLADQPIELHTSYAYIGPELNVVVGHFEPEVSFDIHEVDSNGNVVGGNFFTKVYDSACSEVSLHSGTDRLVGMSAHNLLSVSGTAVPGSFHADLDQGVLRLAPGRWRVEARLGAYLGGCDAGQPDPQQAHGLAVAVDIVVLPSTWSRLELRTASDVPGVCMLMNASGVIAFDPSFGVGVARKDGSVHPVVWPFGWSGWRGSDGVVLLDADGRIVAREGDRATWDGRMGDDGVYSVCGDFRNIGP